MNFGPLHLLLFWAHSTVCAPLKALVPQHELGLCSSAFGTNTNASLLAVFVALNWLIWRKNKAGMII
jgi:hypothetical protein